MPTFVPAKEPYIVTNKQINNNMKQLLHLKSLLIALLVLFGGGGISASEQTETITFSEKGYKKADGIHTRRMNIYLNSMRDMK